MARVIGNSIFGQISGRVGNFIYSTHKGKQYVKAIPTLIIPDQCEPLIPIQIEPQFRTKVNHLLK